MFYVKFNVLWVTWMMILELTSFVINISNFFIDDILNLLR